MLRTMLRGKKLYLNAGFNAALAHELPKLSPSLVIGMIEQRAKECAATGETYKMRIARKHAIGNTRKKQVFDVFELQITRELIYHIMLGLPASRIPKEGWYDVVAEARQEHVPLLLGLDGNPLTRNDDDEREEEAVHQAARESGDATGHDGAVGHSAGNDPVPDHQPDDARHTPGEPAGDAGESHDRGRHDREECGDDHQ